jgi:dTDP-4-dehydrorhamnose 3,5-epimerase
MPNQTLTPPLTALEAIAGVYTVPINLYDDERGSFCEMFRREWFPDVNWDAMQMNRSISKPGVLRGLHYHLNQVDYWFLTSGRIRVGLADLRADSPTYKVGAALEIAADEPIGLFIPVGVAHGFYSLTNITLLYVVNQYYNGGVDERGVAWDDPTLGVDWGVADPMLSERDRQNRPLAGIPTDELPGHG